MIGKQDLFPIKWPLALSVAILMLASGVLAAGQTESVVYRFKGGSNGLDPSGGLISDNADNFYGTTCGDGPSNNGTVFQLARRGGHWTETVLYVFATTGDGSCPFGELTFDQLGNLYGTAASWAGLSSTVFELKRPDARGNPWTKSVTYTFPVSDDLYDGLVFDKHGNLYGSTYSGGDKGKGQIFQLTPSAGGWTETVVHSFTGGTDGGTPVAGPIIDRWGNLFGLLQEGPGDNYNGAVYELRVPSSQGGSWSEHVLYSFKGASDGADPSGRLVFDQKGNLFGVTRLGGASASGTVFELMQHGGSWTEAVLYSFCAQSNCPDGSLPEATLTIDGKGNLFGTTYNGGTGGNCGTGSSCGSVFELTPPTPGGAWTETVLHSFTGNSGDGYLPRAGLILDKFGSLRGTTPVGGKLTEPCTFINGCGTVFNVRPWRP